MAVALADYAQQTEDGRWWLSSPAFTHSEAGALALVEACLLLDVPVTDILTGETWLKVCERIVRTEERLAALEATQGRA